MIITSPTHYIEQKTFKKWKSKRYKASQPHVCDMSSCGTKQQQLGHLLNRRLTETTSSIRSLSVHAIKGEEDDEKVLCVLHGVLGFFVFLLLRLLYLRLYEPGCKQLSVSLLRLSFISSTTLECLRFRDLLVISSQSSSVTDDCCVRQHDTWNKTTSYIAKRWLFPSSSIHYGVGFGWQRHDNIHCTVLGDIVYHHGLPLPSKVVLVDLKSLRILEKTKIDSLSMILQAGLTQVRC